MNTFAMDFHTKPDREAGSGCCSDPYRGQTCYRMEVGVYLH